MGQFEFDYLGPYQIEGILGRGGMGTVYKGRHTKSGEPFAIKIIAAGIADQPRFRRRFAAEVDSLKRLKHPNIVQFIGSGEEQGLLFYSMEFVDGHSLHDHLRQHGRIPWSEVIQVGVEVASALKHAHDFGIIHRDLKPANLLLNTQGNIKLTDFGIAKLFGSNDMTAAGSVIGTADFMPPEQAEGKGVTVRSDLYSLGSVLYALLAGRAPFGGKSVPEVLYSVRYSSVPDLAQVVPEAPQEFVALIHELLEKDPLKRPPTALVVGNRLKALQHGVEREGLAVKNNSESSGAQSPVAKELTSLDLSDVHDPDLKFTSSGQATRDRPTVIAPRSLHTKAGKPSAADASAASLDEPRTKDIRTDATRISLSASQLSTVGPSHFTEATEADQRSYTSFEPASGKQTGFDLAYYASLAGLVILLIASVGLGWWMLRPASANDLYASIMLAAESGDEGELLATRGLIDEFLQRFPKDARAKELHTLSDEAELARWTRVLQRRASRGAGQSDLSAIEQAFLECMQARMQDIDLAKEKLAAFLAVFSIAKDLPKSDSRLVALAQFAQARLNSVAPVPIPAAATQLESLIKAAEASLPKDKLSAFYKNLILLYSDKPWAKEHLSRIRQRLLKP